MVPPTTFSDADAPLGDTLTYLATLGNGSPLPAWLSFDAGSRIFSGTPINGDVGALSLKVTATDLAGATVASTFTLNVANTNDAPVVANALTTQAATEDTAFSFAVPAATFNDIDVGDTLTYSATLADGGALPSWLSFDAATRTFSGTPLNGDVGALSLKVTATDLGGALATSTFTVNIANTNDAPVVANLIANQAATEDALFSFIVPENAFTDFDAGDTLTYGATLANGDPLPSWLAFNAATRAFSGTPLNGDVATISVKVTATDGASASITDTFDITVTNTNDAPTAVALSNTIVTLAENTSTLGLIKVANIDVTDIDLGTNTLSLTGADEASFVIVGNELFLKAGVTLDFETKTHYDVAVTVSDGVGATADATSSTYVLAVTNVSTETLTGTSANNVLTGDSDIDLIFGFGGNDTLSGGGGTDRLTGGAGRDIMTGGALRDVFDFNFANETGKTGATRDRITDFQHGVDDIDLSNIDANGSAAGNTAFSSSPPRARRSQALRGSSSGPSQRCQPH